jgi:hypothetical protein
MTLLKLLFPELERKRARVLEGCIRKDIIPEFGVQSHRLSSAVSNFFLEFWTFLGIFFIQFWGLKWSFWSVKALKKLPDCHVRLSNLKGMYGPTFGRPDLRLDCHVIQSLKSDARFIQLEVIADVAYQ